MVRPLIDGVCKLKCMIAHVHLRNAVNGKQLTSCMLVFAEKHMQKLIT